MRKRYFFLPIFLSMVFFATSQSSSFSWSFQQPTYLLEKENTTLTSYTCDATKDACKVNFDFTSSIPTDEPSTHYACLIDFGFGVTGEENKCNPSTVEFPIGTWTVHLTVKKIADDSVVTEGTLSIIHPDGSIDPLRVTHSREWQSPSYLLLKEDASLSEYSCDAEQEQCKINLKIIPMLDGAESPLLACEVSSDFEIVPTSEPCNPNTSIIPSGEHILTIKILDKAKNTILQTYEILLKNNPPDTTIDPTRVVTDIAWQQPTYLLEKDDMSRDEYSCDGEKTECKINLLVSPKLDGAESTKLTCRIFTDFGQGENDCNPDTFSVPTGNHTLTIETKNKLTNDVITTRTIQIRGLPVPTGGGGSSTSFLDLSGAKITIQSGLDEAGVCKTETCQVNFLAEVPPGSLCEWGFDGGIFETENTDKKCNPGYVRFSRDATVRLRVTDPYNAVNIVEKTLKILKKSPKKDTCTDCEKMKGKIQISAVLPNPPHADTVEWIEIENVSEESLSLHFCKIADEARSYSMTGVLAAKQKLRLRQALTGLSLGNTKEKLSIICGESIVDEFSWDFPVPSGYILRRAVLLGIPQAAMIKRVIDGDTVDAVIGGVLTRLRLLGIDTPETVHPRKAVERFGKEASDFTRTTLEGKNVWLTFDTEPIDHYGRRLAYVWQCGGDFSENTCTLFNASIVTQGYARMERRFSFRFYERFVDLEKVAKQSGIGIWSDVEVAQVMNELISQEKDVLSSEQEKEYLRLQEELLICGEQGDDMCDTDKMSWEAITGKISTLNIKYKKSGIMEISGKTWGDFPVSVKIFSGDILVEKISTHSNEIGEYEVSWIPEKIGTYTIRAVFEKDEFVVQKEEKTQIDFISPHFLAPLSVEIILQGQETRNRSFQDGVFYCRSRGSCSVNLTVKTNREGDMDYFWIFPDGTISDKENPAGVNLNYGTHTIVLIVSDEITGEIQSRMFSVVHTALPKTAKKSSSPKKYTIDIKDIPQDIGGGNIVPEKNEQKPLIYQLLVLFLLSGAVYAFLPFKSE